MRPLAHPIGRYVGAEYGDWTVLGEDPRDRQNWIVRCRCGAEKISARRYILSGRSKGCSRSCPAKPRVKHPPEMTIWRGMLGRCLCKGNAAYRLYGGRGITVCERWQGKQGFANFMADMGPRPSPDHQIDRIDNDGDYCPENCRWATRLENLLNRSNTRRYEHDGRSLTLPEWSRETGIHKNTLEQRLAAGWPVAEALTRTATKKNKRLRRLDGSRPG